MKLNRYLQASWAGPVTPFHWSITEIQNFAEPVRNIKISFIKEFCGTDPLNEA